MSTMTITLTAERRQDLEAVAQKHGVSPEDLVRAGIDELLSRPSDEFTSVVDAVLRKNADLYRRLA